MTPPNQTPSPLPNQQQQSGHLSTAWPLSGLLFLMLFSNIYIFCYLLSIDSCFVPPPNTTQTHALVWWLQLSGLFFAIPTPSISHLQHPQHSTQPNNCREQVHAKNRSGVKVQRKQVYIGGLGFSSFYQRQRGESLRGRVGLWTERSLTE